MFGYIWRTLKRIDYVLVLTPLLLGVISVVIISSITAANSASTKTQIIAFGIGLMLMFFLTFFDHTYFRRFEKWLYPMGIILQLLCYLPVIGLTRYGSTAWIRIGGQTLQPSEFVKIIFVLVLASYLTRNRDNLFTFRGFLLAFLYAIPLIGIVAKEDTGGGIVMMVMFAGMVFAAGLKGSLFLRLAGIFVVMIPVLYRFLDDYQKDRITAFLHPNNFSNTATYQVHQSKIAIGSGGIFGKGIGNGTIKESGFLPVAESDFIFSIICEELGFLGGVAVIALYSTLLFRMWRVVRNAREVYGALLVVGFLCMLGFQMFENIGMTMGIMPVTGITLPFLSSGGTSVMANMAIIGIILSVGVTTKIKSYKHVVTE